MNSSDAVTPKGSAPVTTNKDDAELSGEEPEVEELVLRDQPQQ